MWKYQRYLIFSLGICIVIFSQRSVNGDVTLTTVGVPFVEDFSDFRGAGFSNTPNPDGSQLDSNTYRVAGFSDGDGIFGGTHTTGDFARGQYLTTDTDPLEGGIYAFEVLPGDFAIGTRPSGSDFLNGQFTIRVRNETGNSIPAIRFNATGYFYNESDNPSRWILGISTNDVDYLDVSVLTSDSLADASPNWESEPIQGTIPFATPLGNSEQFYLRFTHQDATGLGGMNGSGDFDRFALSQYSITAVPEPSSWVALTAAAIGASVVRRRRRAKDAQ